MARCYYHRHHNNNFNNSASRKRKDTVKTYRSMKQKSKDRYACVSLELSYYYDEQE